MTTSVLPPPGTTGRVVPTAPRAHRSHAVPLLVAVGLLGLSVVASLTIGARPTSPGEVWQALTSPATGDATSVVVLDQRVPRTLIGVVAGACLAVAGVLMQGLTRNPLADPGLMGVNAGASVAVLAAISLLGVTSPDGYVWFAMAGSAAAALTVLLIGSVGAQGGDPARLVLTGAAVSAGLNSVSLLVLTTDQQTLSNYRFWSVGSLTGRDASVVRALLPVVVVGVVLALICSARLNMLSLGDEAARALGHDVTLTRVLAVTATIALCGSATSMAGPLVFVGLVVPHALRSVGIGDHRWLVLLSVPLGGALVLAADVVGRVIALPGEVEAGLVVALVGAPVLIALVRRRARRSL